MVSVQPPADIHYLRTVVRFLVSVVSFIPKIMMIFRFVGNRGHCCRFFLLHPFSIIHMKYSVEIETHIHCAANDGSGSGSSEPLNRPRPYCTLRFALRTERNPGGCSHRRHRQTPSGFSVRKLVATHAPRLAIVVRV
uniref:Uncharacterized protein n=1 Tax=Anopheles maculatus TaxID=74869 RepID=A0A182T0X8_9DIPT